MFECCKCYLSINNRNDRIYILGRKYHRSCFKCGQTDYIYFIFILYYYYYYIYIYIYIDICNTSLNTHNLNELQSGLYCHLCYFKIQGPSKSAYFMAKWKLSRLTTQIATNNNNYFPDN